MRFDAPAFTTSTTQQNSLATIYENIYT